MGEVDVVISTRTGPFKVCWVLPNALIYSRTFNSTTYMGEFCVDTTV